MICILKGTETILSYNPYGTDSLVAQFLQIQSLLNLILLLGLILCISN